MVVALALRYARVAGRLSVMDNIGSPTGEYEPMSDRLPVKGWNVLVAWQSLHSPFTLPRVYRTLYSSPSMSPSLKGLGLVLGMDSNAHRWGKRRAIVLVTICVTSIDYR